MLYLVDRNRALDKSPAAKRERRVARLLTLPARRDAVAGACLGLCWLPLVAQGLVPAVMKSIGTPTRSWFVALYAPDAFQGPLIAAMAALGLAMFGAGLTLATTRRAPLTE